MRTRLAPSLSMKTNLKLVGGRLDGNRRRHFRMNMLIVTRAGYAAAGCTFEGTSRVRAGGVQEWLRYLPAESPADWTLEA